ncbi:hypothetical protein [Prochlorococcus marinus]|uniref:hypothetical protein n=1 Tax=Prochlorococcus marinus TaxID=1219 RepID=UPI0007BC782E|nr:hypothetical protein [Prochlorococcus marinus]KZR75534.1 hypothetical protein PMIT1323_01826 [Prochlorococcus marinus str. MIT 1323]
MGEFTEIGNNQGIMGLMSGLLSLAAIAIFAVLQSEAENDDDDSNSGGDGGLMQPVT